jgi:hypothetical protein
VTPPNVPPKTMRKKSFEKIDLDDLEVVWESAARDQSR